jgi:hypothetical protein
MQSGAELSVEAAVRLGIDAISPFTEWQIAGKKK